MKMLPANSCKMPVCAVEIGAEGVFWLIREGFGDALGRLG